MRKRVAVDHKDRDIKCNANKNCNEWNSNQRPEAGPTQKPTRPKQEMSQYPVPRRKNDVGGFGYWHECKLITQFTNLLLLLYLCRRITKIIDEMQQSKIEHHLLVKNSSISGDACAGRHKLEATRLPSYLFAVNLFL